MKPVLRALNMRTDLDAVIAIDRGYVTESVYRVRSDGDSVSLFLAPSNGPEDHTFPFDPDSEPCDDGVVVVTEAGVVGICAVAYREWNRRLTIVHFYVDRAHRGQGLGRMLMDWAIARARALGASTVWAETANTNHPGIAVYLKMGFEVCGFDVTHYEGTRAGGTFAVFLARALPPAVDA